MSMRLGHCLIRFRKQQGLTQGQLAAKAGISRRTISYWESGERTPREWELNSVLAALEVSPERRPEIIDLAGYGVNPKAFAFARLSKDHTAIGDLLIALRIRFGYSAEQTAASLGVTYSTIKRWESNAVTPSPEILNRLCLLFQASSEEQALLAVLLTESGDGDSSSLESIAAQNEAFRCQLFSPQPPSELFLIAQERQLWQALPSSTEAQRLLARIYAMRAVLRGTRGDLRNGVRFGRWATELFQGPFPLEHSFLLALWMGRKGASTSEFRWLLPWIEAPLAHALRSELFCQLADCAIKENCPDAGREMVDRAGHEALRDRTADPNVFHRWENTRFTLLAAESRVEEAFSLRDRIAERGYPTERLQLSLTAVHLLQRVGERNEAHSLLQHTLNEIDRYQAFELLSEAHQIGNSLI